ncbi:MAG: hypothetical protein E6H79_18035 [Betaproteobacteria bacterium]|nr:MAG: hypothetical protein E6H79_18035 [Betaproteobacteria bacterium]
MTHSDRKPTARISGMRAVLFQCALAALRCASSTGSSVKLESTSCAERFGSTPPPFTLAGTGLRWIVGAFPRRGNPAQR